MKKIIPVLFILVMFSATGQTPEHYFHLPSNVGVNNLGFNDGISRKFVFIYTKSEIASMVNPVTAAIDIDTIFFRSNTAYNVAITDFKITMGHTTLAAPIAAFSTNFNVGTPQVVLSSLNYNWACLAGTWNVPADKWSAIPVAKFQYDFVNNLAVMIEFTSTSYPEPLYTNNGGTAIIQYAASTTATTATGTTGRPMFGFSSAACSVIPSAGPGASICAGTSHALSAGGGSSYSWAPSAGLSSSTIANPVAQPTSTTTYTVTVSNGPGCSGTDTVTVNVLPGPEIELTPNSSLCMGSSLQLIALAGGASSFSWSPSTGLNNPAIPNPVASPTTTTTYTISVTGINGCVSSKAITLTVHPLPAKPVFTQTGNVLTCTDTTLTAYQWYINNTAIAGATGFSYSALQEGLYKVVVTDSNGCTASSDTLSIILSIYRRDRDYLSFSVSPNPATNHITINRLPNPSKGGALMSLVIADLFGRVVHQSEIINNNYQMDVSSLPSGVYVVVVVGGEGVWRGRFVKQ